MANTHCAELPPHLINGDAQRTHSRRPDQQRHRRGRMLQERGNKEVSSTWPGHDQPDEWHRVLGKLAQVRQQAMPKIFERRCAGHPETEMRLRDLLDP